MKKVILLAMCMVLIGTGAAMAAVVNLTNTTLAIDNNGTPWAYTSPNPVTLPIPTSRIGEPFYTPSATFDTLTGVLQISTNWSPGDNGMDSQYNLNLSTAYLFIQKVASANPIWDYAIDLGVQKLTNANSVYAVTTGNIVYSNVNGQSGWYYGKSYDSVPQLSPVAVANATQLGTANVTWSSIAAYGGDPTVMNTVDVDLSGWVGSGKYNFFWGTGTCANGPFLGTSDGKVPVPPSVLLLGTGLLGLVGLRGLKKS